MSRWVDFGALKQSIGIEQVLASYRVELQRAGHNQLRGPCPLLCPQRLRAHRTVGASRCARVPRHVESQRAHGQSGHVGRPCLLRFLPV